MIKQSNGEEETVEQMQVFVRQKQEKQIVLTMCQEIMRKHPDIFGNQPLYG